MARLANWYRIAISLADMDLERDFLRGVVPVHVLHHAAGEPVHGAWMSSELARHGYSISPGTLYPLLHRMQRAGLLTSTQRTIDGRVLRSYRATAQGRRVLARLRELVGEVAGEILTEQPGSPGRAP
jgi:DNA-binding PadR family transcriptional regulator